MNLENYLNKEIAITQVKSSSKLTPRQKGNLKGLGLKKIGSKSNLKVDNSIIGMIKKVQHIIKIS
ncbi:MAG: 50S ribosomal protein L30 [Rickettsiales bacterium]|jgi:large subunit ribosomal protein L30